MRRSQVESLTNLSNSQYRLRIRSNSDLYILSSRKMSAPTVDQRIEVTIISILISALIVRIIYVFFDGFKIWCEEIFDESCRNCYHRSFYYLINSVLVLGICFFLIILIYEYYVKWKIMTYK